MPVLRNLDLVLLAVALVVFLVTGLPILGWVAGAVIWALWRGIGEWSDRRAERATSAKETAGIAVGSMVGRGWMLGLILLASGLALGSDVGLSAAVLVLVLFSVHFPSKLMVRDPETRRPSTT